MQWAGNSEQLLIQQLTRKQHINRAFITDIDSGNAQELLRESTDSWAEYVDDIHFLNDGQEFTWLSERSGYRHIYRVYLVTVVALALLPAATGTLSMFCVSTKKTAGYILLRHLKRR